MPSFHDLASFSLPPPIFFGSRAKLFVRVLVRTCHSSLKPLLLEPQARPSSPLWKPTSPGLSPPGPAPIANSFPCSLSALKPRHMSTPGRMNCAQSMASSNPINGQFQWTRWIIGRVHCRVWAVCLCDCVCLGADDWQPRSPFFHCIFPLTFNEHLPQLKWQGRADQEISGSFPKHQ